MQYSKLFALAAVLATSTFAAPMPQADAAAAPAAAAPAAVSPAAAPAGGAAAPAADEMVLTLTVTVPAGAAGATAAAASAAALASAAAADPDAVAAAAAAPGAAGDAAPAAPAGAVVGAAAPADQAVLSAPAAGGSAAAAPAAGSSAAAPAAVADGMDPGTAAAPAAADSSAPAAAATPKAADGMDPGSAATPKAADGMDPGSAATPAAAGSSAPAAAGSSAPAAAGSAPAAADSAAPAAGGASASTYTNKTPFKAPHIVTYYDAGNFLPTPDQDIGATNRIALAFYRNDKGGPFDNVKAWLDKSDHMDMKKKWNEKGVAVMMSLFGAGDVVLDKEPKAYAKEIAAVVNESFDGVDVDYEDEATKEKMDVATTWLIDFHKELKANLKEDKLISAAPLAAWFSTNEAWGWKSWYTGVAKEIANIVDFVSLQYYNADTYYTDCSFITGKDQGQHETMGEGFTQLTEIFKPEQIVIGKPTVAEDAPAGGFMEAADINKCLGGTGGIMLWQQKDATAATYMNTATKGVEWAKAS